MPTAQDIQRLRQSTSDDVLFENFYGQDAGFKKAVDNVKTANPNMDALLEANFSKAMLNTYYKLPQQRNSNPETTKMAASLAESARPTPQKGAFDTLTQDPLVFAGQTAKNVLPSVGNLIGGVANMVMNPLQTGKTIFQLGVGGAANTIESIASLAGVKNPEDIFDLESEEVASAVGDFYVQRYGSIEAAATTLRDDPAGFLSDLGAVVTGVGGVIRGGATAIGAATGAATRTSTSLTGLGRGIRTAQGVSGSMVRAGINMEPIVIAGRGVMVAGRGVRATVGAIGPTAAVDRLLSSSMKLHPNQINNFTKLTGESPAQFLVRKGILNGGEAGIDAQKGVVLDGRSIFGRTKVGITDDLEKVKSSAYTTVRKELGGVTQTYDLVDDAPKALTALSEIEATAAQYGLLDELDFVRNLLKKERVTLLEMNQLKERMDTLYNMYTKSNEPTASLVAERLRRVRSGLREFIEQEAEVKGLPDIKMLNRDVQLSSELLNDIERANMTGMGRNVLSLNDILFAGGAFGITGDFFTTAGVVIGRRILESAPFKTTFAKYLNRLTESELKALIGVAKSGKHTKETSRLVRKVTAQTAEDIKNNRIGEMENLAAREKSLQTSSPLAPRPSTPSPDVRSSQLESAGQLSPEQGMRDTLPTTLPEQLPDVNQLESPKGLLPDDMANLTPDEIANLTPEERATGLIGGGGDGMPRGVKGGSDGSVTSGAAKSLEPIIARAKELGYSEDVITQIKQKTSNFDGVVVFDKSKIRFIDKNSDANAILGRSSEDISKGVRGEKFIVDTHSQHLASEMTKFIDGAKSGEVWDSGNLSIPQKQALKKAVDSGELTKQITTDAERTELGMGHVERLDIYKAPPLSKADVDVPSAKGTAAKGGSEGVELPKSVNSKSFKYSSPETLKTTDDITIYRGEGGDMRPNTTYVSGKYYAENPELAGKYGYVTNDVLKKGSKVFDFDSIKGKPNQTVIPNDVLFDPKATREWLLEKGYDATKNTNAGGVEYAVLNEKAIVSTRGGYRVQKSPMINNSGENVGSWYTVFDKNGSQIKDFQDMQSAQNFISNKASPRPKVPKELEALAVEARKYGSAEQFLKGNYDGTPVSNSPKMIEWNSNLEKDLKGLDSHELLKNIPVGKDGNFTINPEDVIKKKLTEFNNKYGTSITKEKWIDKELPNRNDLLQEKYESQLIDLYNQANQ